MLRKDTTEKTEEGSRKSKRNLPLQRNKDEGNEDHSDDGKGHPKKTTKLRKLAPGKSITKEDRSAKVDNISDDNEESEDNNEESNDDDEDEDEDNSETSDDGGGKPIGMKTPRSTNPHERRKRTTMDRFIPEVFQKYATANKRRKKNGPVDAEMQAVLDKAARDIWDEPEKAATNFMALNSQVKNPWISCQIKKRTRNYGKRTHSQKRSGIMKKPWTTPKTD